jgi:subtilisin family serine protease
LDRVAEEHDVLVISAAGNDGTPDPRPADGNDRVHVPGDFVNGIAVGAARGVPGEWQRAAYSSRGPGRAGMRVQPCLMAYGGDEDGGFFGAVPGDGIGQDYGTSYAAPLVAGRLAALRGALGGRGKPEVLRALALHFAARCGPDHDPTAHGYGLFDDDVDAWLAGREHAVTALYTPTLVRGEAIALPVPWQPDVGTLSFRWTISFLSQVDQTDATEYTSSGVEVSWRPNANKITMKPPPKSGLAAVPLDLRVAGDASTYQSLLARGWKRSNPKTAAPKSGFKSERELRDEGKWETLVQSEVRHQSRSIFEPRLWLNQLHREKGVLTSPQDVEPLRVAVVVTTEAAKGVDLYPRVVANSRFGRLNPLAVGIGVTSVGT